MDTITSFTTGFRITQTGDKFSTEITRETRDDSGWEFIFDGRAKGNIWDTSEDRGLFAIANNGEMYHTIVSGTTTAAEINGASSTTVPIGDSVIRFNSMMSGKMIHQFFHKYYVTDEPVEYLKSIQVKWIKFESESNPENNFHFKFDTKSAEPLSKGFYRVKNLMTDVVDEDITDVASDGDGNFTNEGDVWTKAVDNDKCLKLIDIGGDVRTGYITVQFYASDVCQLGYYNQKGVLTWKTAEVGFNEYHLSTGKLSGSSMLLISAPTVGTRIRGIKVHSVKSYGLLHIADASNFEEIVGTE